MLFHPFWSSKCSWITWASCPGKQVKTQYWITSLVPFGPPGWLQTAHLTGCFHFPGCLVSWIYTIISQESLRLCFLRTVVHPIPFVWLWCLSVSIPPLALGKEFSPPWDRGHKCSIISMRWNFGAAAIWFECGPETAPLRMCLLPCSVHSDGGHGIDKAGASNWLPWPHTWTHFIPR